MGHHAGTHYRLEVSQPILTNADLEKIRAIDTPGRRRVPHRTIDATWPAAEGADGHGSARVDRLCREATEAVLADYNILILSDRAVSAERIPIPALLATAAVHHHLIRQGLRTSTGLVVETGEAREVHHFCVLAGYGAEAINPYLAFETLEQIRVAERPAARAPYEVQKNYIKAVGKGILKVMSKMGISTYQSYCGAQIFDAVGLSSDFVEKYFTGTATTIEGVGLREIAAGGGRSATATPMATTRSITTCSMSAATTRSACAARTMPGRRTRSPGCSTRRAATRSTTTAPSPRRSTTRASGC